MNALKSTLFPLVAAIAAVGLAGCSAQTGAADGADEFPSERIRFIVPYAAGGPTDVTARALAPCLTEELAQTVVVENVEGGSGAVGLQQLIGSDADGYTIAIVSTGMVVLTPMVGDLDYSREDITSIGMLSYVPFQLVSTPDSKFDNAEDFFAFAKSNPGELNVGVSGASTPQAIELQRLADEYGVEVTVVPFNGSAGATTALLGGHVDAALLNDTDDLLSRVQDGSFIPLAATSAEPQAHQPDVPTLAALGYEDLTLAVTSYALAGPAEMEEGVVSVLSDALAVCTADEDTVKAIGERFVPDEYLDGAAFDEILVAAETTYGKILGR